MKNILIYFPLLFGLCLLFFSGCRNVSNTIPRTYGGMGEYGTDDVELRKDWYHQPQNSDRSNHRPNENQTSARSTALSNAQNVPELQEIPLQLRPRQLFRPPVPTANLSGRQSSDRELNSVIDSLKLTTLDQNQADQNREITDDSLSTVCPRLITANEPANEPAVEPLPLSKAGNPVGAYAPLPIRQVQFIDAMKKETKTSDQVNTVTDPTDKTVTPLKIDTDPKNTVQAAAPGTVYADTMAAAIPSASLSWKEQATQAIDTLRKELEAKQKAGTLVPEEEIRLQLLEIGVGKTDTAQKELTRTSAPMTRFWQEQRQGMVAILEGNALTDPASAAEKINQAADHFQKGLDSLSLECPLSIRKTLFVAEPAPFGLYQPYEGKHFAGETLYLYTELDHVISRETAEGMEISVRCSWELLDLNGKSVNARQEENCLSLSESRLRDVVLNISLIIPETLPKGDYLLDLTVRDLNDGAKHETSRRLPVTIY